MGLEDPVFLLFQSWKRLNYVYTVNGKKKRVKNTGNQRNYIHGVMCCSIREGKGSRSKTEPGEKYGHSKQVIKENKDLAYSMFGGLKNSIYFHEVQGMYPIMGVVVD